MAKFESVSEYLAALPPESRARFAQVLEIIRGALPGAAEVIAYQMPTFQVAGNSVLHVAAWKRHYSVYPASAAVRAVIAADPQGGSAVVEKGTVRFALDDEIPAGLLRAIAGARLAEQGA